MVALLRVPPGTHLCTTAMASPLFLSNQFYQPATDLQICTFLMFPNVSQILSCWNTGFDWCRPKIRGVTPSAFPYHTLHLLGVILDCFSSIIHSWSIIFLGLILLFWCWWHVYDMFCNTFLPPFCGLPNHPFVPFASSHLHGRPQGPSAEPEDLNIWCFECRKVQNIWQIISINISLSKCSKKPASLSKKNLYLIGQNQNSCHGQLCGLINNILFGVTEKHKKQFSWNHFCIVKRRWSNTFLSKKNSEPTKPTL